MLIRLACLSVANVLAFLRLLVVGDRDKNVEILALRHQIMVLERQLGEARPRFRPAGRASLAALLHRVPAGVPGRFRLLIRPDRDRDRAQRVQMPGMNPVMERAGADLPPRAVWPDPNLEPALGGILHECRHAA